MSFFCGFDHSSTSMANQSRSKSKSTMRATKQSRSSKSLVGTSKCFLSRFDMAVRAFSFLTLFLCFYFYCSPLAVDQTTDIILYSADKYTKSVFVKEFGYVDREWKALNHSRNQASAKTEAQSLIRFRPGVSVFYPPQRDSGA